jgi:hypothetical protein
MADAVLDILDLRPEGIRTIEFSFSASIADVELADFDLAEAQIEPSLKSSSLLQRRDLPVKRVEAKQGRFKPPWKKAAPALYQVTPLVTVVLATSAMVFPRPARAGELSGVTQTPTYHFDRSERGEAAAPTDDIVTAQQIRALNELLALPIGPELDVHIDDWV